MAAALNCASCGSAVCPCFEAGKIAGAITTADAVSPELAAYGEQLVAVARAMLAEATTARHAGARNAARALSSWAVSVEAVARLLIQADRTPGPVVVG